MALCYAEGGFVEIGGGTKFDSMRVVGVPSR
jgi:hypothetical protein